MPWPLLAVALWGWILAAAALWGLRSSLRGTTLWTAWTWAWIFWGTWGVTLALSFFPQLPASLRDQALYWTALVGLCPLIAILGAQRPGVRVWNLFVLLPLLAVLGWPALTVWHRGYPPAGLRIETPVLTGYCVVLLMGVGNFLLIPRWSLSAILYGTALLLTLVPLSTPAGPPHAWETWPLICLGLASLVGWLNRRRRPLDLEPFQRLWEDVRNTFGLVWAARLRERVNLMACKERWNWRLDMEGFSLCDDPLALDSATTRERTEHTLRWLLRRFVDSDWIDARLNDPVCVGSRGASLATPEGQDLSGADPATQPAPESNDQTAPRKG